MATVGGILAPLSDESTSGILWTLTGAFGIVVVLYCFQLVHNAAPSLWLPFGGRFDEERQRAYWQYCTELMRRPELPAKAELREGERTGALSVARRRELEAQIEDASATHLMGELRQAWHQRQRLAAPGTQAFYYPASMLGAMSASALLLALGIYATIVSAHSTCQWLQSNARLVAAQWSLMFDDAVAQHGETVEAVFGSWDSTVLASAAFAEDLGAANLAGTYVSCVLSTAVTIIVWAVMMGDFRSQVLSARRGVFREDERVYQRQQVTMYNAQRFVGNFIGNSIFAFVVL